MHGRQCLGWASSVARSKRLQEVYATTDFRPADSLLLEVGIEDFEVQQRWLWDGHSFRTYGQEPTQCRYENS